MNLIKKILVAQTAVVALWAVSAQAATNDEIAERLKPVGEVCIQGEECAAAGAAAAAAGGAARSGEAVVGKFCGACHGSGFNAMPPKGTCADCSDDELLAAIKHMSGL